MGERIRLDPFNWLDSWAKLWLCLLAIEKGSALGHKHHCPFDESHGPRWTTETGPGSEAIGHWS